MIVRPWRVSASWVPKRLARASARAAAPVTPSWKPSPRKTTSVWTSYLASPRPDRCTCSTSSNTDDLLPNQPPPASPPSAPAPAPSAPNRGLIGEAPVVRPIELEDQPTGEVPPLPHWSEPATGAVPAIFADDSEPDDE